MPGPSLKSSLSALLRLAFRSTASLRESLRRLCSHASLAAQLKYALPASVVVLGRCWVYGTGAIRIGERALFYPDIHFETQDEALVSLGDGVVLSRGVHLVAMAGITVGSGSMIGEYSSIRDANHLRQPGVPIRDAGHQARPIIIGNEVWIGRGVTVLGGVRIGDGATVGANAVVTRDVPSGAVVAGVPARQISSRGPSTAEASTNENPAESR